MSSKKAAEEIIARVVSLATMNVLIGTYLNVVGSILGQGNGNTLVK